MGPHQKWELSSLEDGEFSECRWGSNGNLFTNLNVLQGVDDWFREPIFLLSCYDAPNNARIQLQLPLGVGQGDLRVLEEALIQNGLHTRKGEKSHPVDPCSFPQKQKKKGGGKSFAQ